MFTRFLCGVAFAALSMSAASADNLPTVLITTEKAKVTLVFDRALPNVPGKSMKGVLVEYQPGGSKEEGLVTKGGSDEGGRSELREFWDRRASSAAIRAVCCWMTASSWTINWRITSSVCSQLAKSGGSPAGSGRAVTTTPSHMTQLVA